MSSATKWIDADEQLPEIGGTYLVAGFRGNPQMFHWGFCAFFKLETGPTWYAKDAVSLGFKIQYWAEMPPFPGWHKAPPVKTEVSPL